MTASFPPKRLQPNALLAGLLLSVSAAASAHHSTAAYDPSKRIELHGTVKELQWTNPHSWIQLEVTDKDGKAVEWAIEFGNPLVNLRHGWKRDSVKTGDRVTVVVYPNRNGTPNATLATITLPDGRELDGAADFVPKEVLKRAQQGAGS